jgi:hypothetical protein
MITIGSASTLRISIPALRELNWGTAIRSGCFQTISDHDHQGLSGTGKKLTGYLALDLTTSIITNNTWLFSRNAANSADVKLLKLNTDNISIYLGDNATPSATTSRIANLIMANNTYVQAVNAGNSAAKNILKLNASDVVEIGDSAAANISKIYGTALIASGIKELNTSTAGISLVDNQASAIDTGITVALSANDAVIINYKIVRNSLSQRGTLYIDNQTGYITDEFMGTDCGVTFSFAANLLKYVSTSTGFVPTIYYTIERA